jgi:hypothetical protein
MQFFIKCIDLDYFVCGWFCGSSYRRASRIGKTRREVLISTLVEVIFSHLSRVLLYSVAIFNTLMLNILEIHVNLNEEGVWLSYVG